MEEEFSSELGSEAENIDFNPDSLKAESKKKNTFRKNIKSNIQKSLNGLIILVLTNMFLTIY